MESTTPTITSGEKQKFSELSNYQTRFVSMLTNVKLCSVIMDLDRRITFVNKYMLDITGYTMEEVVSKDWANLFIPEKRRSQWKNIHSMTLAEVSEIMCPIECEIQTKDNRLINIRWTTTLLRDKENSIVGLSSIGEDVSVSSTNSGQTSANNAVETDSPKLCISDSSPTGTMIGDYVIIKKLGPAEGSNVKLAANKNTTARAAIKTLKKENMTPQEMDRARREIEIMKQLTEVGNPYIIKLIDVLDTPSEFHIVLEYICGGELVALILKNQGLSEAHTHKLFKQILSAIETCHAHNIIHRDIKLQNILLDHNRNIKLIDFGLSNFRQDGVFRTTFCGTPAYASPEILLGTKYNGPEVDVWSLGVVLFAMLTSQFPFTTISDILKGKFKEPENVTPECVDLLSRMLKVEKEVRETLPGVLKHPWVTMTDEEIEERSKELQARTTQIVPTSEQAATIETVDEPNPKKRRVGTTTSNLAHGKTG